jgi:hypothetical protein
MNNKQQTAVEWFAEKIRNYKTPLNMAGVEFILIHKDMINRFEQQAKEIEKEQIIEGYAHGHDDGWGLANNKKQEFIHARQYYEQTYGGGEQ